jgi:S-adenosyl-L-methionine hydrolase (adenosine-forming)
VSRAQGPGGPAGRGSYACLTLTTDYGHAGGFVGALHAVAFGFAPWLSVIDLDHSLPPQDVRLGALRLERFMAVAPAGVHVGVVDPGVGTERRGVALVAGEHAFVGPDNGLLVWAAEAAAAGGAIGAVVLDRPEHWLEHRSTTFDGRDVFVPVAAHLASGVSLDDLGSTIDPATLVRLPRPVALLERPGVAELEVLQVDGFGNVQLSGDDRAALDLGLRPGDAVLVTAGGTEIRAAYGSTFSDVAVGEPLVLLDSDGCLALSVNHGRADILFGPRLPARVRVMRPG